MSLKTVSWVLIAVAALGAVLLFNYWASFQLLSTLVYAGIVMALFGLANLAIPLRFLGIRKRLVGALLLAGGVVLALAALLWPASTVRVAQARTRLDAILPEYHFWEKHTVRIHARPQQVLQAVRQSTFADMKSLNTLLKIRAAALRIHESGQLPQDKRILDAFSAPGVLLGGGEQEIVMGWIADLRAKGLAQVRTLEEFAAYRQQGAIKMAFNFAVEEAGDGWCTLVTETRVMALDESNRRGMARYWRFIVPGSGLLRRQWLDGIKRRAEAL
ncbi:MAG TPA: hypothetical protein VMX54_00360 [Vicinamibacteria bacterium]|nr:hypothetical protein [Vicinamibacteria bacterium]